MRSKGSKVIRVARASTQRNLSTFIRHSVVPFLMSRLWIPYRTTSFFVELLTVCKRRRCIVFVRCLVFVRIDTLHCWGVQERAPCSWIYITGIEIIIVVKNSRALTLSWIKAATLRNSLVFSIMTKGLQKVFRCPQMRQLECQWIATQFRLSL